jgi:hypothetical protein
LRDATVAFGVGVALLVRLGLLVMYVCEWLLEASKWLLGHKRDVRANRMQTYAQLLRSLLKWRMHPAKIW